MRTSILITATALIVLIGSLSAVAGDTEKIKQLIPEATAISQRDYDKLIAGKLKKLSDFEQSSLTAVLMTYRPAWNVSKEALEELQMTGGAHALRPTVIVKDMFRQPRDAAQHDRDNNAITWIHSDRMTDFTCVVSGDSAKGTVSWQVLTELKGKFAYVAQREEGVWQIAKIQMAARGIKLARDEHGKWKQE